MRNLTVFFWASFSLLPILLHAACVCESEENEGKRSRAIPLKIGAMVAILVASAIGVSIPTLSKWLPSLRPDRDGFFVVKAFSAGVILATGFIHILPESFDYLTSPCLNPKPWHQFSFAGFIAMLAAIATLAVDTMATGYYNRKHGEKGRAVADEEMVGAGDGAAAVGGMHGHMHGHMHGSICATAANHTSDLMRHRVIAQVLELGIVVHSVIIGLSVGVSDSPSSIRPLVAALCFHQFFEGLGLGGCIVQAQLKLGSVITMILFFSLTTPLGMAIGIGISSVYNANSPTALIVEGVLNSAAAGIIIYTALVDLLAADFMNPRVQKNGKLQLAINASLLVGAGLMSLMAKWA